MAFNHAVSVEGAWRGLTAGGCLNYATLGNNPQWLLHVEVETRVRITLRLAEEDVGRGFCINCMVVDKRGKRAETVLHEENVGGTGNHINAPECTFETTLLPRGYPLTLLPSTFYPRQEASFCIEVESDQVIEVVALPDVEDINAGLDVTVALPGAWRGRSAGGCANNSTVVYNPQFLVTADQTTRCVLRLRQDLNDTMEFHNIAIVVVNYGGRRIDSDEVGTEVASSGEYVNLEEVSCPAVLEAGVAYTVLVSTFHPGQETSFTLTISSDHNVAVVEAPQERGDGSAGGATATPKPLVNLVRALASLRYAINSDPNTAVTATTEVVGAVKSVAALINGLDEDRRSAEVLRFKDDLNRVAIKMITATKAFTRSPSNATANAVRSYIQQLSALASQIRNAVVPRVERHRFNASQLTEGSGGDAFTAPVIALVRTLSDLREAIASQSAEGCTSSAVRFVQAVTAVSAMFAKLPTAQRKLVAKHKKKLNQDAIKTVTATKELASNPLDGEAADRVLKYVQSVSVIASEIRRVVTPLSTAGGRRASTPNVRQVARVPSASRIHQRASIDEERATMTTEVKVVSKWEGPTAGGAPNNPTTFCANPQFGVEVEGETRVVVTLEQMGQFLHPIGIVILRGYGHRLAKLRPKDVIVTSGAFLKEREVQCRVSLHASDFPYVIVPFTYEPGQEAPFVVTVYSDTPLSLRPLSLSHAVASRRDARSGDGGEGPSSVGGSGSGGARRPVPGPQSARAKVRTPVRSTPPPKSKGTPKKRPVVARPPKSVPRRMLPSAEVSPRAAVDAGDDDGGVVFGLDGGAGDDEVAAVAATAAATGSALSRTSGLGRSKTVRNRPGPRGNYNSANTASTSGSATAVDIPAADARRERRTAKRESFVVRAKIDDGPSASMDEEPPVVTYGKTFFGDDVLDDAAVPSGAAARGGGGGGDPLGGGREGGADPMVIEDPVNELNWYAQYFADRVHDNFIGKDAKDKVVIVSVTVQVVVCDEDVATDIYRVIVWTVNEVVRRCVKRASGSSSSVSVNDLLSLVKPDLELSAGLRRIKDNDASGIQDLLCRLEDTEKERLKVGILFAREGQADELEMFGNEHGSPAFNEFLDLIGDRVQLRGFQGYSAQLDTGSDIDGTESVRRDFRNYDIMFHVSTLLHYDANDPQQVQRKRHIGNDIVVIVFMDGNTTYSTDTMRSQYTQVLLVVQPDDSGPEPRYRVGIGGMVGLPFWGPPTQQTFPRDETFVNYLLTKCINGQRATCVSEEFTIRERRTRNGYMNEAFERLYKKSSKKTAVAAKTADLFESPTAWAQALVNETVLRDLNMTIRAIDYYEGKILFTPGDGIYWADQNFNAVRCADITDIEEIAVCARLGSLLVRTSTNLFSLKLPKLVEEDDNHVTLVPHTRNCDLFSFGSVGGDSFFLCAAVGCTVNILNDAFEKVQSVEMPAVLEVLEVTSLGVAVAHGTSYTLVKLTSEGLISQVRTLNQGPPDATPMACFVVHGRFLLCYDTFGVVLKDDLKRSKVISNGFSYWTMEPVHFALDNDRLVVIGETLTEVRSVYNGARIETHIIARVEPFSAPASTLLVPAKMADGNTRVHALVPKSRELY